MAPTRGPGFNFNANFRQPAPRPQMFGGPTGFTRFCGGIFNHNVVKSYAIGSAVGLGVGLLGNLFSGIRANRMFKKYGAVDVNNSFFNNTTTYNASSSSLLLDSTYLLPTNFNGNNQSIFGSRNAGINNTYTHTFTQPGNTETPPPTTPTSGTPVTPPTPPANGAGNGDGNGSGTKLTAQTLIDLIGDDGADATAKDSAGNHNTTSGKIKFGVSSKHSSEVDNAANDKDESSGYPKYLTIKDGTSNNEWTFKFVEVKDGEPIYQFDKDHSDLSQDDSNTTTNWEARMHTGNSYTLSIGNNNHINLVTTSAEADAYNAKNRKG